MEYFNKRKKEEKMKIKEAKKIQIITENNNKALYKKHESKNNYKTTSSKDKINIYLNNLIQNTFFNNQIKLHINFKKYFSLLKIYIISIIYFSSILCGFNKGNNVMKLSEITLKINGTGEINIFSDNFFKVNNECDIYINDEHKTEKKNKYYFSNQNNNTNVVRIIWNKKINDVTSVFSGCDKIIEIDLSKFETSNIRMMNAMFQGCTSLTSLSLPNIDTSNVTNMGGIFNGCNSLISLDLSEFNTSKITSFDAVFASCINLEFVNFKLLKLNNPSTNYVFEKANNKLVLCSKNKDSTIASLLSYKKKMLNAIIIILMMKVYAILKIHQ